MDTRMRTAMRNRDVVTQSRHTGSALSGNISLMHAFTHSNSSEQSPVPHDLKFVQNYH